MLKSFLTGYKIRILEKRNKLILVSHKANFEIIFLITIALDIFVIKDIHPLFITILVAVFLVSIPDRLRKIKNGPLALMLLILIPIGLAVGTDKIIVEKTSIWAYLFLVLTIISNMR